MNDSELIRLDNLQKVGINLSNLIYSSLGSIGFDEFTKTCKSVHHVLQRFQNLTDCLVCIYVNVCL